MQGRDHENELLEGEIEALLISHDNDTTVTTRGSSRLRAKPRPSSRGDRFLRLAHELALVAHGLR